jgi:uncharacterized protein YegP (UPF0339 family)
MRIKVYKDEAGEYRWRMLAVNGKIVCCSGEGFRRVQEAMRSANKVRNEAKSAVIEMVAEEKRNASQ